MAEQNGNGADTPQAGPKFSVLAQYTKDFSFENPNAPRTLGPQQTPPNISIQINVNARQLAPTDYEVSLMLEGGAGQGADTMFKFELNYAGVFRVENFPAEQVQPVVMIEGPRILFPFARQIVADAVRGGLVSAALYRSDRFPGALSAETGCSRRSTAATDGLIFLGDEVRPASAEPDNETRSRRGQSFRYIERERSLRPARSETVVAADRYSAEQAPPRPHRRVRQRRQT